MTLPKSIAVASLGTLVLTLATACNPSADLIPKAPDADEIAPFDPEEMQLFYTLSLEQSVSMLKNNPDTTILDVRTPDEFAEGHLTNALNYDARFEGFRQEIDTLDRSERILVYGSFRDTRNIRVADGALTKMKSLGFRNVHRLTGGFEAWQEAGHPFIRDLP